MGIEQPSRQPVQDWSTDYDIFDERYVEDPVPIWDELRQRCPVAHSDRYGGSWLPTRNDDVRTMARLVPQLSSTDSSVVPVVRAADGVDPKYALGSPPISSDPPEHGPARRLILPVFSPARVEAHRAFTEQLANELIDGFIGNGRCDGAVDFAQQIPPRVIAHLIGIDPDQSDTFVEWVRGVLEVGLTQPDVRLRSRNLIRSFFIEQVRQRREHPRDDFLTEMLNSDLDGEPVDDVHAVKTCNLLLVAGVDTTWSSIGSALWHLASHPDDRRRLVEDPSLLPIAIEELLRAYSPVTMARVVTEEVEVNGTSLRQGDRVLMNYPGANRDPEVFPDADKVVIDRQNNRHIAFGVGIHRCAGSNLARLEMNVAVGAFISRIPEFELEDPDAVTWAGGQVRGPRRLPLVFG